VHTSRVRDWLYGLRNTEPGPAGSQEPKTDAERLRAIYYMITSPREYGGAGITPKHGDWKHVESIFALHDQRTNGKWIMKWSKETLLDRDELDQIRAKFGEKVGFYFAFLQSYVRFLIFPAVFGVFCWTLLGDFSIIYTVVNCLGCIVFVEYWKRQEVDLGIRWQVKGVSVLQTRRRQFKPEREVKDEITGEVRAVFPWSKRLLRQLLQIPFALLAASALGAIIATGFAIEIFLCELYNGPFKTYLAFIPTILLSTLIPTISTVLNSVATRLNDFENHETQECYDAALIQKKLVLNFMTSYIPIVLTAFVYVPFAPVIVPYLDVFGLTMHPFVSKQDQKTIAHADFHINPSRLRNQVIYFGVTAQIVNLLTETVVPFVLLKVSRKYKEYSENRGKRDEKGKANAEKRKFVSIYADPPEEAEFLDRVREEAELPEYDVSSDLREMCIQFGYLSLFSTVWPLMPVSFLINNWVELRSDFFKICKEYKRPTPQRTDTIGPWLDTLGLLAWLGSISTSALVYMFCDPDEEPGEVKAWALLLTIFFAEHIYLAVRYVVEVTMSKIETPSMRQARAQQFLMRQKYLESSVGARGWSDDSELESQAGDTPPEQEADAEPQDGISSSERFWSHQRSWKDSVNVGADIIMQSQGATRPESKKQR
jgi:hypothetical protein